MNTKLQDNSYDANDNRCNNNVNRIQDVFVHLERLFTLGGIWPTKPTYIKYTIYVIYCTTHLFMAYADFVEVFGDLELMVANLMETIVYTITFSIVWVIRCNGLLKRLIDEVRRDIAGMTFENDEEEEIYYKYNYMSMMFYKITISGMFVTVLLLYIKPLLFLVSAGTGQLNDTNNFILPCHVRTFFNIPSVEIYVLCYILLCPVIYESMCHMTAICVLVTLVFHICGKLSILSYRIKNMNFLLNDSNQMDVIVQMHLEAIWMSKSLASTFNIVLLDELFGNGIVLAISMYYVLLNLDVSQIAICFSFAFFAFTALVMLYGYCFIGEQLIQQSLRVNEAYYNCKWYERLNYRGKDLLICMIYAQSPFKLTAGGFYTFSLNGFTEILKTTMAYVSILRTLL